MRHAPNVKIEHYRLKSHPESMACSGTNCGAFVICHLFVIAWDGGGWDHVSVQAERRVPTWTEMCAIKELFFRDDEVVMQLHPAKANYVNNHYCVLHLWRPQTAAERAAIGDDGSGLPDVDYPPIPLPPKEMV